VPTDPEKETKPMAKEVVSPRTDEEWSALLDKVGEKFIEIARDPAVRDSLPGAFPGPGYYTPAWLRAAHRRITEALV